MENRVTKAVFPVARSRHPILPATKASPAEMLPVVDKPLIQYAVEEAMAAGITEMIFVTGRSKRAIEDHFDKCVRTGNGAGGQEQAGPARCGAHRSSRAHVECYYVRQPEALGLGHAVLCAAKLVGDNAVRGHAGGRSCSTATLPIMKQMVDVYQPLQLLGPGRGRDRAREQSRSYGVVEGREWDERVIKMSGIVEKPAPEDAPVEPWRGGPLRPHAAHLRPHPRTEAGCRRRVRS